MYVGEFPFVFFLLLCFRVREVLNISLKNPPVYPFSHDHWIRQLKFVPNRT